MLVTMIAGIFVGIPVSFTLIFLALGFGYISMGENVFDLAYYNLVGGLSNDVCMAIPMFIFLGYVCQRAGLIEGLFDSLKKVTNNLYLVVIVIAVLISLATGVEGASVTLLGIMPLYFLNTSNTNENIKSKKWKSRNISDKNKRSEGYPYETLKGPNTEI